MTSPPMKKASRDVRNKYINFATEGKCYRYGSINMPINMWGPWHTATHKTEGGLADVKISMEDMITPEKVMDISSSSPCLRPIRSTENIK